MTRGPTIYDIAALAKVGIATVSRVINGSARVAEATRASVQRAMDELGFRPNRAARHLAVGGPDRPRVAALLPFFSTNFYYSVCKPLSQGLVQAGIDLVLFNVASRDDKQRLLERLVRERSAEGLLLCSMGIGSERQAEFSRLGVPVVVVDYPLPGLPSVTVDNVAGGARAAQHLITTGSKRLGLLNGPEGAQAFRDRERGFRSVAGEAAPLQRALAVTIEDGRTAARILLERHSAVDGLVCANDLLALGALDELRRRGARVPDDVQVIGYDDQPLMDVLGLSTVRQPMERFGVWAAEALRRLLIERRPAPASTVLPLTLVPRATTRSGNTMAKR